MKKKDISKDILCVRMDCSMKQFVKVMSEELGCNMSSAVRLCILVARRALEDEATGGIKALDKLNK